MSWLRLEENVLSSKGVAQATTEHGALGAAAWIYVLTKCKRDGRGGGLVEVTPIVMGRELGEPAERCAGVIMTLATTAALMAPQAEVDMYVVPKWEQYQPDSRAAGRERSAQGDTGTSKVSQGHTGQRNGTERDQGKTSSAHEPRRGGSQARRQAADAELKRIAAGDS